MSEHLLHPELYDRIPMFGGQVAEITNDRAAEVMTEGPHDEDVSVVIRALNEAGPLKNLLKDVHSNIFAGEVEIVVVDNESSDSTADIARDYGATVVTIPRDKFTHPLSLNTGMEAASHDAVFMTVAHANLTNTQLLQAGSRHIRDGVAGIYGTTVPNSNASRTERLVAMGTPLVMAKMSIEKAGIGVLGVTNAMISKSVWRELGGFDMQYERGGEDTLMAGQMLKAGLEIVRDPALSVHHTHGLGPINYARQVAQWQQTLQAPQEFDREQWANRRPDLNFD